MVNQWPRPTLTKQDIVAQKLVKIRNFLDVRLCDLFFHFFHFVVVAVDDVADAVLYALGFTPFRRE